MRYNSVFVPLLRTKHKNNFVLLPQIAQDAIRDNYTDNTIAAAIRKRVQAVYPLFIWHCFVGRNFSSYVSHEASKYIYFYVGQIGVCLFATA